MKKTKHRYIKIYTFYFLTSQNPSDLTLARFQYVHDRLFPCNIYNLNMWIPQNNKNKG